MQKNISEKNGGIKVAVWTCTNACNLDCKFCFGKEKRSELSTKNAVKLIKRMKTAGIKYFIFSGGEPLLRKDIFILAEFAKKLGIKTYLHTNGTLINEKNLDKVARCFDVVNLPIDGADEKINLSMGRGSLRHTLKLLDSLAKKCELRVTTVATKINLMEIEKIAMLLKNRTIKKWRVFQFNPKLGEAKANNKIFEINSEKFNNLQKKVKIKNIEFIPTDSNFERTYWMISSDGKINAPPT